MIVNIPKNDDIKVGETYGLGTTEYVVIKVDNVGKFTKLTLADVGADTPNLAKEIEKLNQIENLTVIVNSKVFSVNDASQSRIHRALRMADELNITETDWKLAEEFNGSKVVTVTVSELKEALIKGMYAVGEAVLK